MALCLCKGNRSDFLLLVALFKSVKWTLYPNSEAITQPLSVFCLGNQWKGLEMQTWISVSELVELDLGLSINPLFVTLVQYPSTWSRAVVLIFRRLTYFSAVNPTTRCALCDWCRCSSVYIVMHNLPQRWLQTSHFTAVSTTNRARVDFGVAWRSKCNKRVLKCLTIALKTMLRPYPPEHQCTFPNAC